MTDVTSVTSSEVWTMGTCVGRDRNHRSHAIVRGRSPAPRGNCACAHQLLNGEIDEGMAL